MKKFKALLLGLTMTMAFGMLTACGEVPEPTKDDVLDALVDEDFISKDDVKDDKYTVEIKEVDINDDQDRATVDCELTYMDGPLEKVTEYTVKFKIRDDKESWRTRSAKAGDTTSKLAEEISEEEAQDLLEWESFYTTDEEAYINLDSESTTYKITKHDIDEKEMSDTVTIEGTAESGYYKIEFTAKYTFMYSYGWYITEEEVVETTSEYVDGYEITELTAEELQAMFVEESEYFYLMGRYYYPESDTVTIGDVELGEITYEGSYAYVQVNFSVAEADVKFFVESELEMYFDTDDMAWEFWYFNELIYTSYTCDVIGTWTGTTDGEDTCTMTITGDFLSENESNLYVEVTGTTANGAAYSYSAYVSEYDPEDSEMCIYSKDWITEPEDDSFWMSGFDGYIDESGVFAGSYSWDHFSFQKSAQ